MSQQVRELGCSGIINGQGREARGEGRKEVRRKCSHERNLLIPASLAWNYLSPALGVHRYMTSTKYLPNTKVSQPRCKQGRILLIRLIRPKINFRGREAYHSIIAQESRNQSLWTAMLTTMRLHSIYYPSSRCLAMSHQVLYMYSLTPALIMDNHDCRRIVLSLLSSVVFRTRGKVAHGFSKFQRIELRDNL
jgi:hypothetical protein